MESGFDPSVCPVGIGNTKEVEHLGDKLDMAISNLTEKVSEMKDDIASLHDSMDEKFDAVDRRFDDIEDKFGKQIDKITESIPQRIDDRLNAKKSATAAQVLRWIFCGAGGTILIAVLTAIIKKWLGL